VIAWVWGPKPVSEFEPVVIVPDMFGSFVKDTGPVLDPIFQTYDNLIATLVGNGYVEGQTLFTFPYDWEASNAATSQALGSYIQAIKSTCGCSWVNVIAHGTGGLVTEQYIESASYGKDINSVVFLGTPFLGAPAAYQAWEGGQINFGNPLQDGLTQVLLNAQAKEAGYPNAFSYIQGKPVSSFQEMLPIYNYLSDSSSDLYYPGGYPRNTFLEGVVSQYSSKILNKIQLKAGLADDGQYQTTAGYQIEPSSQPPLWPDGHPAQTFTDAGDSFVPRVSIENFLGYSDFQYAVSHLALPDAAQTDAFSTFNGESPSMIFTTPHPVGCVLFVSTSGTTDLQVTDPNGARLGKNLSGSGELNEIPRSFYSGSSSAPEYIAIANPVNGSYQVKTQGTSNGSFTINTADVCNSGTISTSTTATTGPGQLIGFGLVVSPTTLDLSLESLDTHAPVITITSPQNNTAYLTSQNVPITATVTDPEGSPLAATTYKVNGLPVNPALLLSTSTLGTSTLVVSATDIFGNTGYATSTFAFVAPPPPPPPASSNNCILTLSATAKPSVTLAGSSQIQATGCGVQVNASGTGVVDISGATKITSSANCIVGTVKKSGSASISPAPLASCNPKADPYASHAEPAVGACTYTNYSTSGAKTVTLSPGVYCGGIKFTGSSNVTFSPGVYILKNGGLTTSGSTQIKGNDVSIYMTGAGAGLTFGGSTSIQLKAPSTGTLAGFVFFLDTTASGYLATSAFSGSTSVNLEGVVYLPKQKLDFSGSTATGGSAHYTAYVVDTLSISGASNIQTNANVTHPPTPPGL
jgi:hypothetical protein